MFVLRLHCPDRPGIVAAVAGALAESRCNIEESSQFHDPLSNTFFMRVAFAPLEKGAEKIFQEKFSRTAGNPGMSFHIDALEAPVRALILVSKEDHCLNDILYRRRAGRLNIEITGVVSNHETARGLTESHGLPFYYAPADDMAAHEKKITEIIEKTDTELVVLARYMRILSKEMCEKYAGRVINIHHSFLPGFKGAKPYHQAYERGVKIIGATAHFATRDLDEGPIIAQETIHVGHACLPEKMRATGSDIEELVLARAIQLYAERRIFLNGMRTVIL